LGFGYQGQVRAAYKSEKPSMLIWVCGCEGFKGAFFTVTFGCAPFLNKDKPESADVFVKRLEASGSYAEVWQIVKDSVDAAFSKRRGSMMLFLDGFAAAGGSVLPRGNK
jgi:hypothetical protein